MVVGTVAGVKRPVILKVLLLQFDRSNTDKIVAPLKRRAGTIHPKGLGMDMETAPKGRRAFLFRCRWAAASTRRPVERGRTRSLPMLSWVAELSRFPVYFFFLAGARGAFFAGSPRLPARPVDRDVAPCTTGGLAFLGFLSLDIHAPRGPSFHLNPGPVHILGVIIGSAQNSSSILDRQRLRFGWISGDFWPPS